MLNNIVLICGQYEGFDERIRNLADEEVSIGDFVLNGGELPAMIVISGVVRLLPGTVGTAESLVDESHNDFFSFSVKKLVVWMDLAIFWVVRKKI